MESRIWTCGRKIKESLCGMWENGFIFFQGSFEFAEREDNSKDNCSVFLSVVFFVLQWKT